MSCSLPFPQSGCPDHGSRQVCNPGSASQSVRPPPLPEVLRSRLLADPGPSAAPAVICRLIYLQMRCRVPLFLPRALSGFQGRAADFTPLACAFSILQPLGRRGSACGSRHLLPNGLSCPPGSPDLAARPPAGLSPTESAALATVCNRFPYHIFFCSIGLCLMARASAFTATAPPRSFSPLRL
jgi:hypothetical protein